MFKRIKSLINKPKERRLQQKEEIKKKLPKKSFSRKFYGFTKDLKNETIVLRLPTGKIIYQREGSKNKVLIPFEFLKNLKKKGVNLSKCTLIHNHTIPKNSDISILPSIVDISSFLQLYKKFKITNYTLLLIDKKTMQEFGRCFVNLASKEIKKKIEGFKSESDLSYWFASKTKWFGREALFLTIEDLKSIGFNIKLQGLNGHKYDQETRTFKQK